MAEARATRSGKCRQAEHAAAEEKRHGAVRSPRVSVIVPSYNKPQHLPDCLNSVKAQTFTDWECIVVSDGSPQVEEIRAAVAAMRDERFRLVELAENRGPSAARNTGVCKAQGELLFWLDEDDRISPDCLTTLLGYLEKEDAEIVCPHAKLVGGGSAGVKFQAPSLEEILVGQPLLGAGFLVRRDVLQRVGFYDEDPRIKLGREDHEWWIRAVKSKAKIHVCDEELYEIRRPATAEEIRESRYFCMREHEYEIWKYMMRKHQDVYQCYPELWREIRRRIWRRKAEYLFGIGRREAAVLRLWAAALVSWLGKDFREAAGATMKLALGRETAEALMRWWRRLKAAIPGGDGLRNRAG